MTKDELKSKAYNIHKVIGFFTKDELSEEIISIAEEYAQSRLLNKRDVSRSACTCGVPLERTKHSDLMFGDWYKDIEAYYCPKCGELHSVDEF